MMINGYLSTSHDYPQEEVVSHDYHDYHNYPDYHDYHDYLQEEVVTRVSTSHDRSRLLLLVLLGSLTLAALGAALGLFLMLRLGGCDKLPKSKFQILTTGIVLSDQK